LKAQALEALARADRAATTSRLFQLRQYRAAYEEGRRCLAANPKDWPVQIQLADMLIFARRYPEAAREYAAVLAEPAFITECTQPMGVALLNNNLAWASFMHGSEEALEAADSASLKSFTAFPKNPHFLGTRGAVLVASGRVKEGQALLIQSLKGHRDARSRASVLGCLALAASATVQHSEARGFLESALKLDPTSRSEAGSNERSALKLAVDGSYGWCVTMEGGFGRALTAQREVTNRCMRKPGEVHSCRGRARGP
jgi:tetratricopeptide (TPR) repeat protein